MRAGKGGVQGGLAESEMGHCVVVSVGDAVAVFVVPSSHASTGHMVVSEWGEEARSIRENIEDTSPGCPE